MVMQLSREQARYLLAQYHFTPTDISGVFARLGTVQYDPLNPVGRNPDLVFQARVPGYRVDDWQDLAYTQREVYDAWDKQACLVPISDWSSRALVRERYRAYHDQEILQSEPGAVEAILAALDERGPLSSLEFEKKTAGSHRGSWAGATQAKRILRALWTTGEVVTHHRHNGRHYYDRASRVVPAEHFGRPLLLDEDAYHRWIIARRYQATGLLRPNAESAIWAACGYGAQRKQAHNELLAAGTLTPVQLEGSKQTYYAYTPVLEHLDKPPVEPRVLFLGPLDSLLWDRRGVREIFDFDYLWEVYKPEPQRKWGYYVLPVWYGSRFIARVDSRLERGTWRIIRWWWEPDITPDATLFDALQAAFKRFLLYMGATGMWIDESVDVSIRTLAAHL